MPGSIETVADLLTAIRAGRFAELSPADIDKWLPSLVVSASWSTSLSRHFLTLYHAEPDVGLIDQKGFLEHCEELRAQVLEFFGKNGCPAGPAVAGRHLLMLIVHARSPVTFGTVVGTDLLLYLLDTQQDPHYLDRFRHEITHFVWGSIYGEAPGLLNEGVAVATETLSQLGQSEADLFAGIPSIDSIPPLAELCRNERFFEKGTGYYKVAGTFVHFLTSRWSWPALGALFQASCFDDPLVGDRLSATFGLPLDDLDRNWREYCTVRMA